ncbi:MAG: (deoxy)nucleoside triphosphate pyrophosphohydrolase [Vicinamibacterales bacterium]
MTLDPHPRLVVTAAIVERDGTFLVTRRPRGTHLEGLWEFPGGKCEPGESHPECLRREIQEELGVPVAVHTEIFTVSHAYDDRVVELHFFACEITDEPQPLIGQEIRWVSGDGLLELDFPPADAELIELLRASRG